MSKQPDNVPKQMPGESFKDYDKRVMEWAFKDTVRSKFDLRDFKTCDFHLAPERDDK
jgi:hypothetical protein